MELAKSSEIEAAVLCHPSFVNVDDMKGIPSFKNWSNSCFLNMFLLLRVETICFHHLPGVKCPISILGAENDHISPPELLKQFEQALSLTSEVSHLWQHFQVNLVMLLDSKLQNMHLKCNIKQC